MEIAGRQKGVINMTKKATIRDVAKEAEVSVATVSRVLNGQSGFSAKTQQRVWDTIKTLGYERTETEHGKKEKQVPRALGLIVPQVNEYFCGSLMRSVEDAARKRGYVVILCNAGADAVYGDTFVRLLKLQQIAGIIACSIPPDSPLIQTIWEAGIPCVLIDSVSYEYPFPYVKIDDFQGMYAATKFLLDRGHRRIAILSGKLKDPVAGFPRMEGYRQALREEGLASDPKLEAFAGNFSYQSGQKGFEELVSRKAEFTGLVVCSDVVAAAAINAAAKCGIRVPQDLSVVGFDDSKIASLLTPPLTSVAQPYEQMGETAVHILVRVIEQGVQVESRVFPVQVVERETTRRLEEDEQEN